MCSLTRKILLRCVQFQGCFWYRWCATGADWWWLGYSDSNNLERNSAWKKHMESSIFFSTETDEHSNLSKFCPREVRSFRPRRYLKGYLKYLILHIQVFSLYNSYSMIFSKIKSNKLDNFVWGNWIIATLWRPTTCIFILASLPGKTNKLNYHLSHLHLPSILQSWKPSTFRALPLDTFPFQSLPSFPAG